MIMLKDEDVANLESYLNDRALYADDERAEQLLRLIGAAKRGYPSPIEGKPA